MSSCGFIEFQSQKKLINDPWIMQTMDFINCEYEDLAIKQEPQTEYNFMNSGDSSSADLNLIEQFKFNNNNNTFNYTKEAPSPWETSNTDILDEQILSPSSTMSKTSKSDYFNNNTSEELFALSDENKIMNFDEYDTPTLNFEDEYKNYTKVVEEDYNKMLQNFEKTPEVDYKIMDDSMCQTVEVVSSQTDDAYALENASQNTFCSQDPVVNPILAIQGGYLETAVEDTKDKHTNSSYNLEHNYTIIKDDDSNKVVEEQKPIDVTNRTQRQRVPKLKLKIPREVQMLQSFEENLAVSTPELTNQILDLEKHFDLVEYINVTAEEVVVKEEKPERKRKSSITIEELSAEALLSPKHNYNTRTRASSPCTSTTSEYFNPGSVQSVTSDDSYTPKPAKRRGRPPKPVPFLLDPVEIANLDPEDQRYRELRNKNNEASRRSRLNRKDRETQLEQEANELESQYRVLEAQERRLHQKCKQFKEAVMKIALL